METLPKIPSGLTEDSWEQPLIRKGFVRRGYIAERLGLHPAVRFVYQPMLPEEADRMAYEVGQLAGDKAAQASSKIAKRLIHHVKSWSIDGMINEANFRSLGDTLLNRIRVIVAQQGASDIDPLWQEETEDFKSVDQLLGESLEPSPSE
jgi:hypothetical protein